jgi:hypothetical protein
MLQKKVILVNTGVYKILYSLDAYNACRQRSNVRRET